MGYLAKTSLTSPVDLSAGYSAQARALRADEEDAVQAAYLGSRKQRATAASSGGGQVATNVDLELDNAALIRETLLRGIVSWDLDDDAGQVLPITPDSLKLLTGGDRNTLFKAINDLTSPPDHAEGEG